jgi:hypothetical protein
MAQTLLRRMLLAAANVELRGVVRCLPIATITLLAAFARHSCRISLQSRFFLHCSCDFLRATSRELTWEPA